MRSFFKKAPTPVERIKQELTEIGTEKSRLTRQTVDGQVTDADVQAYWSLDSRERFARERLAQAEEDERLIALAGAAETEKKAAADDLARRKSAVDAHAAQGRRQIKAAASCAAALNDFLINFSIFSDAANKRDALRPEPLWGDSLLQSGELLIRVLGDHSIPFRREIARLAHKHGVIDPVLGVEPDDFDPASLVPVSELVADMVKTCDAVAREQLLGIPAVGIRPPERVQEPSPPPRAYRNFVSEIERIDLQQRTGQSRAEVDEYFASQWSKGDALRLEVKQPSSRPPDDAMSTEPASQRPIYIPSYTIDAAAEMRAESRKLEFGDASTWQTPTHAPLVATDEPEDAATVELQSDASATSESSAAPPSPADAAVAATPDRGDDQ